MADSEQIVKIALDDILPKLLERFVDAEHEKEAMKNFIRENAKEVFDLRVEVPKYLRKRYGINPDQMAPGLAWYLLDEYFKGNITIKKDEEILPKS